MAKTPQRSPAALFLTREELCQRWKIGRSTSYALQASGYLPAPVRLGAGVARFPLAEIERIETRAAADRGGHQ